AQWLADTDRERRNAGADLGVLVMARAGIGAANADRWWAVLPLHAAAGLLAGTQTSTWWAETEPGTSITPVRMHLSTACAVLRVAGFGTTSHHLLEARA
ncbi:hypothetical protein, partial [Enterococcus hirae]|uniref:hypothetical protein n=1 Tax=Enterococcus hirae TaxID=1354 RepID=UPI0013AC630C